MPQEKMSQDEIDALVKGISLPESENGESNESQERKEACTKKYFALKSAERRLMSAREYGTADEARFAAQNVHKAAFALWLMNKRMEPDDYYTLMNKEAVKRGLKPPFPRFVNVV